MCIFDVNNKIFVLTVFITHMFIPSNVIGFLYSKIYQETKKIKDKIESKSTAKSNAESIKLAKTLFFKFAMHSLCL